MKGFIRMAATLAVCALVALVCSADCFAQRCGVSQPQQTAVSSAAAIENARLVSELTQLRSQVAAAPRTSTATASAGGGTIAQRRALSAPAPVAAAPAAAPTVSAVASSNAPQQQPRRGIRGIIDRNRADSVAYTRTRPNGATRSFAATR